MPESFAEWVSVSIAFEAFEHWPLRSAQWLLADLALVALLSAVLRSPVRVRQILDSAAEHCGRLVAWLTLLMVLITFTVVVLRYGFSFGSIAMQESILYMHATVFLLGGAYALRRDAHVRVDVFYRIAPVRWKAGVNLLGTLFLLLPFTVFVFGVSWEYVAESWRWREGSRETGGIPAVYLLKTLIPLSALLLHLQAVAELLRSLEQLYWGRSAEDAQAAEGAH